MMYLLRPYGRGWSDQIFQLTVLLPVHPSSTSQPQQAAVFPWKRSDEPTVRSLPSTKQQAAKMSEQLVHRVDHLISKGADTLKSKQSAFWENTVLNKY